MKISINKQDRRTIADMVPGDIFIHKTSKWLAINKGYGENMAGFLKVLDLDNLVIGFFIEPSTVVSKYIGKLKVEN